MGTAIIPKIFIKSLNMVIGKQWRRRDKCVYYIYKTRRKNVCVCPTKVLPKLRRQRFAAEIAVRKLPGSDRPRQPCAGDTCPKHVKLIEVSSCSISWHIASVAQVRRRRDAGIILSTYFVLYVYFESFRLASYSTRSG